MNRIDMIEEYAITEQDKEYINGLSDEIYQEAYDIAQMEGNATMQNIMEYSLTHCIHTADYNTECKIEKQFPNVSYSLLNEINSNSDWTIERNEEGYVTATVSMSNEHYLIMSLLHTLDEMKEYIVSSGVAVDVVLINNEDDRVYDAWLYGS